MFLMHRRKKTVDNILCQNNNACSQPCLAVRLRIQNIELVKHLSGANVSYAKNSFVVENIRQMLDRNNITRPKGFHVRSSAPSFCSAEYDVNPHASDNIEKTKEAFDSDMDIAFSSPGSKYP